MNAYPVDIGQKQPTIPLVFATRATEAEEQTLLRLMVTNPVNGQPAVLPLGITGNSFVVVKSDE